MPFCCFWSLLVLFLHVLTMVLLMQLLLVLGFLLLFCFLLIRPRVGLFVWRETDERLRKKSTIWEASEWRAPSWCFWWNAWRYCLDTVWIVCILILVHFTFFFRHRAARKPGAYWKLPMPIMAWPWITTEDSMPTGMSQRDLSRFLTSCGVWISTHQQCPEESQVSSRLIGKSVYNAMAPSADVVTVHPCVHSFWEIAFAQWQCHKHSKCEKNNKEGFKVQTSWKCLKPARVYVPNALYNTPVPFSGTLN